MRILILSFYHPPDLSAGSFRVAAFIEALRLIGPPGMQVSVLTTLPNRYHSFDVSAPSSEITERVDIHRIPLPGHRSGMADQAKAFLVYARAVSAYVAGHEYDIVFATSSRLMTAALGAWIARRVSARLYLDIRDIFADTIKDVIRPPFSWVAQRVFSGLEKWACNRADRINLVSEGFSGYFQSRYPQQKFSFFSNGIDAEFMRHVDSRESHESEARTQRVVTALYAGNIGEGQGLHLIVPALAKKMQGRVRFRMFGDGGRKAALDAMLLAEGLDTVEILPPVGRQELRKHYGEADVLFLHLNDHDAFRKVLPSKIFEYAATGKPIWAGVSGYAAQFIAEEVTNASVFHPCDVEGAVASFQSLDMRFCAREEFVRKYARANISREMAKDVLALVDTRERSG